MFWNKILPLAALLCCAALLLPGCRPSPALEQVIYDQQAPEQDPDSQTKLVDNREEHQERDDSLSPKDLEEDSPDQRDRVHEDPVPGPAETETPAPDVRHDEDGTSGLSANTAPDLQGEEAQSGQEGAPAAQELPAETPAQAAPADGGTGGGGTGTEGTGTVPVGGGAVRQVVNAYGAVVEVPENVETVAAVGEAALMVQMLGGPGRLTAADEGFLSDPLAAAVFADEAFDSAVPLWSGDGSGGISGEAFSSLLSLAPQACLELSGQHAFSEEQIAALAEAGIPYVVLPSLNTTAGLKQAVSLTGEILGDLNGVDAPARAAAYLSWFEGVVDQVGSRVDRFTYNLIDFDNDKNAYGAKYLSDAKVANHSGHYTLFLDGWDAAARYKLHGASSVTLSGTGLAVAKSGYSHSPLSYYMSLAGVVNAAAIYPDYGLTRSWYANPLTSVTKLLTVDGGYGRLPEDCLTQAGSARLGQEAFPAVVVKRASIAGALRADPLWASYPVVESASGLTTSNGFLDEDGSIVPTSIAGEYEIYVNPTGVGDWTAGSVESILEPLWISARFNGAFADAEVEDAVRTFYREFYRHDLTEEELSGILAGPQ